jgi:hypothetical protein
MQANKVAGRTRALSRKTVPRKTDLGGNDEHPWASYATLVFLRHGRRS